MTEICDHCSKPLGESVIYDHGKRYHPLCFEPAMELKRRKESNWRTTCPPECDICRKKKAQRSGDWPEGVYET